MHLSYVFLLILWVCVFAFWWNTRQQIEEMKREIDELGGQLEKQQK